MIIDFHCVSKENLFFGEILVKILPIFNFFTFNFFVKVSVTIDSVANILETFSYFFHGSLFIFFIII